MSNPAFIVDGFTEKLILGRICPGRPVRRTDLNGKSVTIQAIINKVYTLIRLLNNRYYPIILVIDREDRDKTCEEIEEEIHEGLLKNGLEDHDIRISVADRMIENWIIADWKVLGEVSEKPEDTDGKKGATVIKKELGSYGKTTDGINLFLQMDPKECYRNSPSFKNFIDRIADVDCYFTDFDK